MGSWQCLYFRYHSGLYTMQEPSHLSKIVLVWCRMVSTQIITLVYKNSLTLIHPPNINFLVVLQIWFPWVGSLTPLLVYLLIPMHSPVYQSNVGMYFMHFVYEDIQFYDFHMLPQEYIQKEDRLYRASFFWCNVKLNPLQIISAKQITPLTKFNIEYFDNHEAICEQNSTLML
jgi:hypothetical protein